jgi:hypothetical protein
VTQPTPLCQDLCNEPISTLSYFQQRLPAKPYHANDVSDGLLIRSRETAIQARYIQPNGPTHLYWMIFDVDTEHAALDWNFLNAPPPTLVIKNPINGHAHLLYGLKTAIRTAPDGSSDALRYAAAVEYALRDKLKADPGYAGFICKNPLHTYWITQGWESRLYELSDLESWVDLKPYSGKDQLPAYGLGRNCTLFEELSEWSYRAIRQGWPDYDRWFVACLAKAEGLNIQLFANAEAGKLKLSEVRATAKSVAKWTHKHFSPEGFSQWQATQGRKGGIQSGKVRRQGSAAESQPWIALGISRRTYYRRKKAGAL